LSPRRLDCWASGTIQQPELNSRSIRNTAMGTVYNLARAFQFVTQAVMGILIVEAGVAHGLYLAMGFALVTATWVWTFPETRATALAAD